MYRMKSIMEDFERSTPKSSTKRKSDIGGKIKGEV